MIFSKPKKATIIYSVSTIIWHNLAELAQWRQWLLVTFFLKRIQIDENRIFIQILLGCTPKIHLELNHPGPTC